MKTIYTAHVTTIAGRDGTSKSDDGKIDLKLGRPGSSDTGTNPEQLFAAGYSACFGSAIAAVAKKQGTTVSEIKVQADVDLNQDEATGFSLGVTLNVTLAGVDTAEAQKIVEAAHQMCPYSKATRGNVDVKLNANGTALKQAA